MHPNPVFRSTNTDHSLAFARERSFGTLAINADPTPLFAHVPFLLSDDATHADLHLVRSNPIVRILQAPQKAVIAVTGADAYISPDWYGVKDQVPTWNYTAVHLRGELSLRPPEELRSHLDALAAYFEARLLPKPPWTNDKVTPDAFARMLRMIVPVRLTLDSIDGTWKLGQNKGKDARAGAADGLEAAGFGCEHLELARLMRDAEDL